jgi:mRNA interferase YafQ
MYTAKRTGRFKSDFKLCIKREYNMSLIETAMRILLETGTLPHKYLPHPLKGNYMGFWECHIEPNWLMIWYSNEDEITFVRTGIHSDLFK